MKHHPFRFGPRRIPSLEREASSLCDELRKALVAVECEEEGFRWGLILPTRRRDGACTCNRQKIVCRDATILKARLNRWAGFSLPCRQGPFAVQETGLGLD